MSDTWLAMFCVSVITAFGLGMWAVGSTLEAQIPTHYSNGYCAALEGVRLSDEACDVNGKVVMVK